MKLRNAMSMDQLQGRRVFVYKNLHENCWSVRDKESGHVVAHADRVELSQVQLKVGAAGRERVLREQSKNVHAGLEGNLQTLQLKGFPGQRYTHGQATADAKAPELVTYNPYKYSSFVIKADETPVFQANRAVLENDGRSVWITRD